MSVYLANAIAILVFMTLIYWKAQRLKDNSIVDSYWGPGFCMVALVSLFLTEHFAARPLLVTAVVLLWGVRLGSYIHQRNKGKGEDYRYVEMRKRWGDRQRLGAFVYVFMLQGALMFVISLGVQNIIIHGGSPLNWLDAAGVALWAVGFYFEVVGDAQLKRFKSDPANKGRIMTSGLWSLTRHPNYFGEILMWWGIFVMSLNVPYWYLSLAGTLVITFLLMKVSGVPMLEKKYKGNPEYDEYAKKVPALFPRLF